MNVNGISINLKLCWKQHCALLWVRQQTITPVGVRRVRDIHSSCP
jgi:hypothetical protein